MAECSDIQAELSAYLDGELTAQERSTLEAHLSACPQCRAALDELRSVATVMSELPRVSAPSSLMTKIRRDIANEPALREQTKAAVSFTAVGGSGARPRSHWAPFVMGMAALVILCLLAFVILPAVSQPHDSVALGTPPREEESAAKAQAPAVIAQDQLKKNEELEKDATPAPKGLAAGDGKKDGKDDGLNLLEEKNQQQNRAAAVNSGKDYRADKADFAAKKDAAAQDRAIEVPQERAKAAEPFRKRLEEKGENAAPVAGAAPAAPRPGPTPPPPSVNAPIAPRAPGAVPAPGKGAAADPEARRERELTPENRASRNNEAVEKQKTAGLSSEKLAAAPEKKARAVGEELRDAAKKTDAIEEKTIGAPDPEGGGRAAFGGKPGENKAAGEKVTEAKKLADGQAQGGQPKAGEDLSRQQSEQAATATRRNSLQRDGAASTGGLAGNGAAKDSKNDASDFKRAEQNGQPAPKPDVALGGGAGPARGAASETRLRKAESETLKAPGAPPATEPPQASAAAPSARLLLAQTHSAPAVVRVRAKDLQRAVSDLKKIVESSGGHWEDVAILEGKAATKEAEPAAKSTPKPTAGENRDLDVLPASYVAVTSAAQRESLLAKLNAYSGATAQPFADGDDQRQEATDKAVPKKAKKAPADEAGAGALNDKPREPAKPTTTAPPAPAATASAAPGEQGEARIQIRIEIIPE